MEDSENQIYMSMYKYKQIKFSKVKALFNRREGQKIQGVHLIMFSKCLIHQIIKVHEIGKTVHNCISLKKLLIKVYLGHEGETKAKVFTVSHFNFIMKFPPFLLAHP